MARNEPERRRPRRGSGFRLPGGHYLGDDREKQALLRAAVSRVKDRKLRQEMEDYLSSGTGDVSPKALKALEEALRSLLMMRRRPK